MNPRIPPDYLLHVRPSRTHCALLLAVLLASCATVTPPGETSSPGASPDVPPAPLPTAPAPYVEPPPPPVNLQGFPPDYRLGFGDGCATSRGTDKRDPVRFANNGSYRTGWNDGLAQCKKR